MSEKPTSDADSDPEAASPLTHLSEDEFGAQYVVPWLEDAYGAANVTSELHLDKTDRRADVIVNDTLASWAIEIENDEEAIYKGVTQALLYAQHRHTWRPCVVTPPNHVEQPERSMLEAYVRIADLPETAVDAGESA